MWKDVDGILTADPRLCPAALPVTRISFEEAAELAYFGAQVHVQHAHIHSMCVYRYTYSIICESLSRRRPSSHTSGRRCMCSMHISIVCACMYIDIHIDIASYAQVLHPLAMQPCMRAGVPFRVKNSYNPEAEGTLITTAVSQP